MFGAKRRRELREALERSRNNVAQSCVGSVAETDTTEGIGRLDQSGSNDPKPGSSEPTWPKLTKNNSTCSFVCHSGAHVCSLDVDRGCPSCQRTCHADCRDVLCEFVPCGICLSMYVVTHIDSDVCRECQLSGVCHTCGVEGCWSSSPSCVEPRADLGSDILHEKEKPRAFWNLGSSCWMNSAVQALMAPVAFKRILTALWQNLRDDFRQELGCAAGIPQHQREAAAPLTSHQVRLSATLSSAHVAPRLEPLCPALFTEIFYKGVQDDAAEFVRWVLHPRDSPSLSQVLEGRMDQVLTCNNTACKHPRETTSEYYGSLTLPLRTAGGEVFGSVQEAVDKYMPDETVALDEICQCGRNDGYTKTHSFIVFPKVLVVFLNRWAGHHRADAVLHSIKASPTLSFRGTFYRLCASVCHLGPNPNSGHYVTVARHPTELGDWWLYDDSRLSLATPEQVTTMCIYDFWGPMQCYVLMYER